MIDTLTQLKDIIDIGIVGGSNLDKQKEQLKEENLKLFKYIFSENGLMVFLKIIHFLIKLIIKELEKKILKLINLL